MRIENTQSMGYPAYRWHNEHGCKLFDMAKEDSDSLFDKGWRDSAKAARDDAAESEREEADSERDADAMLRSDLFLRARALGINPGGRIGTDKLQTLVEQRENANLQSNTEDSTQPDL